MSPRPHTPPVLLLEELVEEVLLRLPPDDPAGLVRSALVCKIWRRVISGPAFRRRIREFHRAPPMLGFFANLGIISRFVRGSSTCPPFADHRNWKVIDARHGRVLLCSVPMDWEEVRNPLKKPLIVWDPITDHWRGLPLLPGSLRPRNWNAAVLCASSLSGICDHLDCHSGPFLVVLLGTSNAEMLAYIYSSEDGVWSEPSSVQGTYCCLRSVRSALVGSALYFFCSKYMLKYDLGRQELSVIHLSENYSSFGRIVTMTMEGGGLGFATVVNSRLLWWSWEASRDLDEEWIGSRSIELETLLPAGCEPTSFYVIGCTDSTGVIFLHGDVGILTLDLNSSRVTKVWKETCVGVIFPYLSFYTPAFGESTGEGSRAGIPSA